MRTEDGGRMKRGGRWTEDGGRRKLAPSSVLCLLSSVLTGFRHPQSTEEGIEEMVAWYRGRGKVKGEGERGRGSEGERK
jgi:hypothetical protein